MSDKIEKMTDDDFKKIMQSLGMPDSVSLYSALKQVENHTWQACAARMVPEKKVLPELLMAEYHEAKGWNACVESMLAAAPEGKK